MSPPEKPKAPLAAGSVPPIPVPGDEACAREGQVAEYLDGALDAAAQAELLSHLATCEPCQAALHGEIQLRDREDELRSAGVRSEASLGAAAVAKGSAAEHIIAEPAAPVAAAPAPVSSLAEARAARAARWKLPAGLAAVAAAAAAALLLLRSGGHRAEPMRLALAPTRSLEGRLGWAPAAGHRPYHEMMRSSTAVAGERIDPEDLARLARDRNCAGLAATYVLSGELARAEQEYAQPGCRDQLAIKADRAALAVAQGKHEDAIELADEVLAEEPDHPVALWNRALALRGLGLGLDAAAAFEHLAAVDPDAGWKAEAEARARALRAPLEEARRRWEEVLERGRAMIPDGEPLPLELARAVPGRARLRFHDAVRTATTVERLEKLRPLAQALTARGAGQDLERYLDDAKRHLGPARAALIPQYVELFRKQAIEDEAAWRSWQARARAAGAEDLLLGAYYLARPDDPETERLAAASKDPWFIGLTAKDLVVARHAAGDDAGAQAQLERLEQLCKEHALPYLCLMAKDQRAELALDAYQPGLAAQLAREALQMATEDGEFFYRTRALWAAGDGERKRHRSGLAVAYFEEYALSMNTCEERTRSLGLAAETAFLRHRFAETRRLLAALPKDCDVATPSLRYLRADLVAAGLPSDRASWLEDLRAARAAPDTSAADRLMLEYLEHRAALPTDRAARQRLTELIGRAAAAAPGSLAARVKAGAEILLVVDAARTGEWKEAIDSAARAHRVATPPRCALAMASDHFRFAAVTIAASGEVSGLYQADSGPHEQWRAPAALAAALAGCDAVSVLAFPPWHGVDPPLPPATPWSFLLGGPPPPAAPAAAERMVVVANPSPPAALHLPALTIPPRPEGNATMLSGASATLSAVAAAAVDATIVEFHAHTARVATSDAPAIALTDAPGGWALTAEEVSKWRLTERPVVLLADCVGGVLADYDHVAWGLPAAFRAAGARAVVASLVDIPDGQAAEFFAAVREGLRRDPDVARVVARLRAEMIQRDPSSWTRQVVVFQ